MAVTIMKRQIYLWVILNIVLHLTCVAGVVNKTSEKELRNLNSLEVVRSKTGKDGDKSATLLSNSYARIPLHRTIIGGHGGFGVGLGTSLRVGGPRQGEVVPSGDSYGTTPNYVGSASGHGGSGVHISGNGYSYGRPGYTDEQPPPFTGIGERQRPSGGGYADGYGHDGFGHDGGLIYQGHTGGGRPPIDDRPSINGQLSPPIGGHPPFGGHPPTGGYPPSGGYLPSSGHGPGTGYPPGGGYPPIGGRPPTGGYTPSGYPGGHGGHGGGGGYPVGGQGGGLNPIHKLALKKLLIPIAGVAVLGAAAALASANPILLQLGVTGKRRRRNVRSRRYNYPRIVLG